MADGVSGNWKEILLKSGLPLESSVRKILQDCGFEEPYEHNFVRKNIDGVENNFSVDFLVSKTIKLNPEVYNERYNVSYLIECKYCSPDTNWVFASTNYEICSSQTFMCEIFDTNYQSNSVYTKNFISYPLVYKGVSLKSKSADSCQITSAYNQLAYGFISSLFEYLSHSNQTIAIVPIIVTTANLWRIKSDVTLEKIQSCKNIEDVCEKSDVLLSQLYPDNLMRKYYIDSFNKLEEKQKEFLIDCCKKNYPSMTIDEAIEAESIFCPDSFLIINYNALEGTLKELNNYFFNSMIVKPRENRI